MRTSVAIARSIVAVLIVAPVACSLFSQNYECGERDDDYGCNCYPIGKSSPRPGYKARCERQYDCCIEYEYGSFMVHDPSRASGCQCGMLKPGQTCDGSAHKSPGYEIKSRPKSCPP